MPGHGGNSAIISDKQALLAFWGLSERLIDDPMTDPATFDLALARNPAKTWFLHNRWTGTGGWPGELNALDPSDLQIDANGTQLLASPNTDVGYNFACAVDDGAGGYIGNLIKVPFYIDFDIRLDPAEAVDGHQTSAMAVWLMPYDALRGTWDGSQPHPEIDLYEGIFNSDNTTDQAVTLWEWDLGDVGRKMTNNFLDVPMTDRWQRVGHLFVPSTANDGVGLSRSWFDGARQYSNDAAFGPDFGAQPSEDTYNGIFTCADDKEYVLIVGSSYGYTAKIRNVTVYQRPGA